MLKNAKWIAKQSANNKIYPAPMFRKSFEITKQVKKATLDICGLGLLLCYVNGEKVSDEVLLTPHTKYDTRVIYNTYDVTNLINNGNNVLGAILGNGCYFVTYNRWDYYKPAWLSHPKLIASLVIEFADGTKEEIVSDTSWKTTDSAIIYNETRRGEIFDARLYDEKWACPDYNDNLWSNAFICRGAGGVLEKRNTPPIRVTKQFKATRITNNVYDIGQNISGWARIKAVGEKGREITLRYSERLHDDQTIAPEFLNTIIGSDTHVDKYIMSGNGVEEWAPSFAYHGFRYVEVTGAPENFELIGEFIHTDFDIVGSFTCSDQMLNRIHHASVMSTLSNFVGIPTDCPQREQNAWTGDALVSLDQMMMNFDAISSFEKWLNDIKDTQRPNGQLCCIAPTSGWGYNWGSGPAWDSIYIWLPYYVYYYTGQTELIDKFWDSMALYMDFIESMSENDLVCFGLGDWCAPENTKLCPTIITDTSYFYKNNKIMARCAQLIGKDGSPYQERAEKIKNSFRENFIEKDFYLDNNTCAIACAIYQDLYTDEEKPLAAKYLSDLIAKAGYHIDCGILGLKFLFSALSEYGYAQTMYNLVTNPDYPSYAYWMNNGMTTLCETWDMEKSCNHHMYSEVDMWFYKHIAGIKIDEGGKSVTINPVFVKNVSFVSASHKGVCVNIDKNVIRIKSNLPGKFVNGNKILQFTSGEHEFMI